MSVSFGKVQGNFDSLIGTIWRSNLLSLHILIIKTNDYFVQINGMINYPTLHLNFPLVIFLVNALSRIRSSHRMIVVANLGEIKSSIKYTLYGFSQYLFMHFFFDSSFPGPKRTEKENQVFVQQNFFCLQDISGESLPSKVKPCIVSS